MRCLSPSQPAMYTLWILNPHICISIPRNSAQSPEHSSRLSLTCLNRAIAGGGGGGQPSEPLESPESLQLRTHSLQQAYLELLVVFPNLANSVTSS